MDGGLVPGAVRVAVAAASVAVLVWSRWQVERADLALLPFPRQRSRWGRRPTLSRSLYWLGLTLSAALCAQGLVSLRG